MAVLTRAAVAFAGGRCVWEYDYDDVSLILTRVRCANTADYPTRGTAKQWQTGRTFTTLVPPGGSLDQALPTNPSGKFDITIDPESGAINGVDWYADYGPQVT